MRTPEGWEKAALDRYLHSIKGLYLIKPATFGYGGSGAADRVGCFAGRFFSIEVKREGKVPTALQNRRATEVREAGGIAIWGNNAPWIIEQFKQAFGLQ